MRAIGLDVHLEFCEVAIAEGAELRSAGRIATRPEEIELFARSLGARDRVALEVTGNAWEIKRLIEPHVAEVIVVSPGDTAIRSARAKTDRLDARALARLLAAGELEAVWVPDRAHPGDAQAPSAPRPAGLGALAGKEPDPREPDALPRRPRPVLRSLRGEGPALAGRARAGRGGARVGRLGPAPGRVPRLRDRGGRAVDLGRRARERRGEAADDGAGGERDLRGDLHRGGRRDPPLPLAPQAGRLPRARSQGPPVGLGPRPPTGGSRSRARSPGATRWSRRAGRRSANRGRCTGFYERIRARRGHQVAIVACGRKLACLFWCLLSRSEDYAYAQPSLTRKKLRRLELAAGAPSRRGTKSGPMAANAARRKAERELAQQAEAAYRRTVSDWQATQAKRKGAGATPGRASHGPSSGQAARQVQAPGPAL